MATSPPVPVSFRIVVVGDVQYDWDPVKDHMALKLLKADLVLFTGNFGEENVELVKSVSKLDLPKCVILGNHDCWWSAGPCKRYLWVSQIMRGGDSVQGSENITAQLRALGPEHVGYGRRDYPKYQISVVGGRPFSSGGPKFNPADLLSERFGVRNMRQSEFRITEAALGAPVDHSLIFLAHYGPSGLTSKEADIAGARWINKIGKKLGNQGDQGDPDLAAAVKSAQFAGRRKIPLVVFGHMQTNLGNFGARTIVLDGTVHLYGSRKRRCRKMMGILPLQLDPEFQANVPAPDAENNALDAQKTAPDAQRKAPDTPKKAPDTQKKAPDTQKKEPDAHKELPDPKKKAPDTKKKTGAQKNASVEQADAKAEAAEAEKKALEEVERRERHEASAATLLYQVTDRQFTVVNFQKGQLKSIAEVWVRDGDPFRIVGETQIFTSA